MKRALIPQTLLAALLASAAAGAAPATETRGGAAPVAFSGVYSLTFAVNAGSTLSPGATILCKAKAVPNAGGLESFRFRSVPVVSSLATGAGSGAAGAWANCTVQIPFYWAANDAQGGAVLSYEIDLVNGIGSGPGASAVPVRRQGEVGVAYPAPGGSASLRFNVRF